MSFFKKLFSPKAAPKPEPKIDYNVAEIKVNYLVDYDFQSWIVEDSSLYKWLDGPRELEFTLVTGKKKRFLNCNMQSQNLSVFWKGKFNDVWLAGRSKMLNETISVNDGFQFDNRNFVFSGNGEAEVEGTSETYNMKNWLFECDKQEYLVSFNKYEDNSIEVYIGKRLKDHEVSNIMRRDEKN